MELLEAIEKRFSVRRYTGAPLAGRELQEMEKAIAAANREGGLHFQLTQNSPDVLKGFVNGNSYIALVAKKSSENKVKLGYYGEKLVLTATALGLGTCWVSGSYQKSAVRCRREKEEMLCGIIVIGYPDAEKPNPPRATKPVEKLCRVQGVMPAWFRRGMEAVQKAPSGMNVQPVRFLLKDDTVEAKAPRAFFGLDIGIARLHFELGAGNEGWHWAE